jgi:bifunctional non-homologous end joining protein LigD
MLAEAGAEAAERPGGPLQARPGEWLLELKLDGLRCLAVRNGTDIKLYSRNRLLYNQRFGEIARSLASLPVDNFVLDGEIVAMVGGRPDFSALQEGKGEPMYMVFDLLWLLGRDIRGLPIDQRKQLLEKSVPESSHVKVLKPLAGEPRALLEKACRDGWEGLVAKRSGSPYRAGRSRDWLKLKCVCRQELVVGGFTAPKGSRAGFGALLVGYWQGGRLLYAGKVGTGFSDQVLRQLAAKLRALERPSSPFAEPVEEKEAHFVEPELVAEVAFSEWTPDGRLRHPSFVGLRPDKPARQVVREGCLPRAASGEAGG